MNPHLLYGSRACARRRLAVCLLSALPALAAAEPLIAPGRSDLRIDLELLADAGVIEAPLTTWPISWQSVIGGIEDADIGSLSPSTRVALERLRGEMRIAEQTHRFLPHVRLGGASETIAMRTFSAVPREKGELEGGISFTGDRLSFNLAMTRAIDSHDDWRLDGSYVGLAVRDWAVVAGYPERWWGPGFQGSLILSTNARPVPQIGIERISANRFERRWLSWLGPWTLSSFIGELDDARVINQAKLFGFRLTARPLPQLQIGLARTAQLCGDGRACGLTEFGNMLLGKDNQGRNVAVQDEPGNQLGGFDGRWSFRGRPFAVYWQWIGEDSRQGGPQVGSWLRLVGAEWSGEIGSAGWRHRIFFETADTTCQEGGGGFGGDKYDCAYQHGTYRTGMRYEGRPLGYPTDTDSESFALIAVLTNAAGRRFEAGIHSARINQGPATIQPHSLSLTPASRFGIDVAHVRDLPVGRLRLRLNLSEQRDQMSGRTESDTAFALEWLVGYW